jgi:hypothetical protein
MILRGSNWSRRSALSILISFDIDGTLETGDPPGPIKIEMVRKLKDDGFIVGSCSDRPVPAQKQMWERHQLEVSFTVLKHELDSVKSSLEAEVYCHIGDTDLDKHYANLSGFEFRYMTEVVEEDAKEGGLRFKNLPGM